MRRVLQCCIVTLYRSVPITLFVQSGCTLTVQQQLLWQRRTYGALVAECYVVQQLVEQGVERGTGHALPA